MTGYDLRARFNKANEQFKFTTPENAIYSYLSDVLNELYWHNGFLVQNKTITEFLSISENTLSKSRKRLMECGLLIFETAQGSKEGVKYWLITHEKMKTKTQKSLLISGLQRECTDWFCCDFYLPKTKLKYIFDGGKDAANLQKLLGKIYAYLESKDIKPTTDMVIQCFKEYVQGSFEKADKWENENFTLPLLNSKFNVFIRKLSTVSKDGNSKSRYEQFLREQTIKPA